MTNTTFIAQLNAQTEHRWQSILKNDLFTFAMSNDIDVNLYASIMYELYHYTRHNSINQAAAAFATSPQDTQLLKFVYHHAADELGHENMVLSDLKRVGVDPEAVKASTPLAPTTALTAYIYQVALTQGAKARLGYSFWAEDSYGYIDGLLKKIQQDLNLEGRDMSFFVAHSAIDEKHAEEVQEAIELSVKTPEEQQALAVVADTTLYLTGKLLEEALVRYQSGWKPTFLDETTKAA